jgi:hypothetical protein
LNKYVTVVGTWGKTKPEILALFLSGKQQRDVHSSIFGFTSDLTLVSNVPARNKTVTLFHHSIMYTWLVPHLYTINGMWNK